MDGLALFLIEELGRSVGARLVQRVLGAPQERQLRRVVDAALASPRLAELAPEAERPRFLAVLREHPSGRPSPAGGLPLGATALRELIRLWVEPLDEPVAEQGSKSYLDLHEIDPGRVVAVLHDEILAGIRADAVAGGPLRDLFAIIQADGIANDVAAIRNHVLGRPPAGAVAGVAPVETFTGRDAELAELVARLTEPPPDAVPVLAIHGPPGIGKSALAGELGRHPDVVERYPDGVLLVDLLGWTDGMEPPDVGPVLAHLLGRAGVPEPADGSVESRLHAWRGWLTGRRVLVVLDNAHGEKQVRHLLPDQPGCALVVTSRERMGHLAGATVFPLGALADADAAELLRTLAGPERLDDAEATARILALCGGWPLAIRLAGGIFRNDADATAAEVAQALTDASAVELDPMTARLRVSYDRLDDELRRAFRWLASWDGPDVTPFAAGLLLDLPAEDAVAVLRRLARAELLLKSGERLWRPHDLVRVFASRLNLDEDPWQEHYRTARRMVRGYLTAIEDPDHVQHAGWLASEDENVAIAAQGGVIASMIVLGVPPDEAERAARNARLAHKLGLGDADDLSEDASRLSGDALRLAELGSNELGRIGHTNAALYCATLVSIAAPDGLDRFGRLLERDVVYPQFTVMVQAQVEELRLSGDERNAGRMLLALASYALDRGDSEQARASLLDGLRSARVASDPWTEANGLVVLARLEADRGAAGLAREHLTRSLALFEELGADYLDPVTGKPIDPAEVEEVRERLRALDAEGSS